jgi:hypothetical protein
MKQVRTVVVDKPLKAVFDYVSDFTTTTDWDPGTVITMREHGNGGLGTTYRNTPRLLGRTTELTYLVEFTFKGLSRLTASLLKPAFERLGNQAAAGLRKALNRL